MEISDIGWEIFSKTGEIDAYLMYKTGRKTETENYIDGKRKNERFDNKKRGLR